MLVIDASSSMKRTDPSNLRKVAAELFVDLARAGDRIAVTGFDENARQSTGAFIDITTMDSRTQLKKAIRAIGNDGKWTDFTAGLSEAKRLLDTTSRKSGEQDLVVFLTDGKCEPDPNGPMADKGKTRQLRTQACKDLVLNDIAPSLADARVYAIGLSKGAPRVFLEELGRRTGGRGEVTLDPKSLPSLFAGVYARLLGSRLREDDVQDKSSFEVYKGAQAIDVVIVGRTERTETVRDPTSSEIAIHNRSPDDVYFASAKEYRFYKIRAPKPGVWTIELTGKGKHRVATLQHFDLDVSFVDAPTAVEMGHGVTLRARLASKNADSMPPMAFLDRHQMSTTAASKSGEHVMEMIRQPDGIFSVDYKPTELGQIALRLSLEPKSDGVLSRHTGTIATLDVIPPMYVKATPVQVDAIKQRESGTGTLSFAGSHVGVAMDLSLQLRPGKASDDILESISMTPQSGRLSPTSMNRDAPAAGQDSFILTFEVADSAPGGTHELELVIIPVSPEGFSERGLTVAVTIEVIPLTFWERYGTWVIRAAGALLAFIILLGFILPAKFKKRAILYYADIRDPELVRRSSYPLGTKSKRGFYRAASVPLGPSGPVKKGGAITLIASPGGRIQAALMSKTATVFRVDVSSIGTDDDDESSLISDMEDDERPRVSLKQGSFRVSAGVGYEVKGSGFVFWYK